MLLPPKGGAPAPKVAHSELAPRPQALQDFRLWTLDFRLFTSVMAFPPARDQTPAWAADSYPPRSDRTRCRWSLPQPPPMTANRQRVQGCRASLLGWRR